MVSLIPETPAEKLCALCSRFCGAKRFLRCRDGTKCLGEGIVGSGFFVSYDLAHRSTIFPYPLIK